MFGLSGRVLTEQCNIFQYDDHNNDEMSKKYYWRRRRTKLKKKTHPTVSLSFFHFVNLIRRSFFFRLRVNLPSKLLERDIILIPRGRKLYWTNRDLRDLRWERNIRDGMNTGRARGRNSPGGESACCRGNVNDARRNVIAAVDPSLVAVVTCAPRRTAVVVTVHTVLCIGTYHLPVLLYLLL